MWPQIYDPFGSMMISTAVAAIPVVVLLGAIGVFEWGIPQIKTWLDGVWIARFPITELHNLVQKVPPVVLKPVTEGAVYNLNLLSATGTGILLAAILAGFLIGYGPMGLLKMYGRTLHLVRYSLLTISCTLALGFVTRYSGTDATLGVAFAQTGWLYPLFGRSSAGWALH